MGAIETVSEQMAERANDLLNAVPPEQRAEAILPFEDEDERRRWYYTPTPRVGLRLNTIAAPHAQKVMQLIASGLSEAGYNHSSVVMGLENLVDYMSGFPDRTYGDLPNTRVRDPGNYFVAVFGTPGDPRGWSWRVGGHHVSLHFTLSNGAISPLPSFWGAEPARFPMAGGRLLRVLEAQEDFGRELLEMLNPDQRATAVISPVPPTDVVQANRPRVEEGAINDSTGAGPSGSGLRAQLGLTPEHEDRLRYTSQPKGLPASAMDAKQRDAFARLVRMYFSYVAEPIAGQYEPLLDPSSFNATTFAWAGSSEFAAPQYYRVQGDRLLIEYDSTQNDANHTHTVWRDPIGDFGEDILARHYAAEHR